jgi:hypothetical protein
MASFIPRFEWNDVSVVGDTTSGNPTITGISSTENIIEGMIVDHADFPADAYVVSKTGTTITMSANATATTADTTVDFFQRFTFTYPSVKQARPEYLPSEQVSESIGGGRQVQINNIIKKISLEFKFLTAAQLDDLEENWYLAWAVYGYTFRYFESYESTSEEYELDVYDFKPTREIPKEGDFLHKVGLKFRRVYL